MWSNIFSIAHIALLFSSPLAGFAILDVLNCIRKEEKFWLPSKIVIVVFVWSLGWSILTYLLMPYAA
ncbi:MAG: hypothetical protein LUE11_03400 [Clostridia bacterium]|nr:hypothetical protein [Clostridia bacterium]